MLKSALQHSHTALGQTRGICRLPVSEGFSCHLAKHECMEASLRVRGGPAGTVHLQDFYELAPHKFQNKTNGVTPRRWLAWCNPGLAALITETLGTDTWPNDLNLLAGLRAHADDREFQQKWRAIKHENKAKLAAKIKVRPTTPVPCVQRLSLTVGDRCSAHGLPRSAQHPDRASQPSQTKDQGGAPASLAVGPCRSSGGHGSHFARASDARHDT